MVLLFVLLFVFRAANSIFINSSYVPDETYQSLEVAYRLVFGTGYLTWEWGTAYRLRSGLHVLYYIPSYLVVKSLGLSSTNYLIILPRLQQALIAAVGDLYTYRLASLLHGPKVGRYALYFSLISWFNFFHSTRTLANSLESALFVTGLYYWHRRPKRNAVLISSLVFGLSCAVRPTSVLPVLLTIAFGLLEMSQAVALRTVSTFGIVAGIYVAAGFVVDTMVYRVLHNDYTLPYAWSFWRFVQFNIIQNMSAQFGTHAWYYYFALCVPQLYGTLMVYLPWVALPSVWHAATDREPLLVMLALSFLAHKELRFLCVVWPQLVVSVARAHARVWDAPRRSPLRYLVAAVAAIGSVVFCFCFARVFNADVRPASQWLRDSGSRSVVVLTSCFDFPGHSYLGAGVAEFRSLTCVPEFARVPDSLDAKLDRELFFNDVRAALTTWTWEHTFELARAPDHIAISQSTLREHRGAGLLAGYDECARFPLFLKFVKRPVTIIDPLVILCKRPQDETIERIK